MVKRKKRNAISKTRRQRIDKRKLWQAKSIEIRARDNNQCCICNNTEYLNVHHIIPKQNKDLWLDNNNLITLCCSCHKYNYELSAHKNPFAFLLWLKEHKPNQYNYLSNYYLNKQSQNIFISKKE
jgi:5-methylcytosine-specific restriction endonuclease McrA